MSENFLPDNLESDLSSSGFYGRATFICFGRREEVDDHPNNPYDRFVLAAVKLKDLDDIQPAGDYLLDTDEEVIEGLTRLAYLRVATLLHLPSTSRPQSRTELVSVNPVELDAVLESDRIVRA